MRAGELEPDCVPPPHPERIRTKLTTSATKTLCIAPPLRITSPLDKEQHRNQMRETKRFYLSYLRLVTKGSARKKVEHCCTQSGSFRPRVLYSLCAWRPLKPRVPLCCSFRWR